MKIGYFVPTTREIAEFKRCFYLAKYIVEMGHEATIVSAAPHYCYYVKTEIRQGVKLIQLPYFLPQSLLPLKSSLTSQKASVRHQEYLGQLLRGFLSPLISLIQNSDVVHAFTVAFPMSAFPALASKVVKRRRLVVDWVDLWSRGGWARFHNAAVRLGLTLLEEKTFLFADSLTVTSDFLANRAINLGMPANRIFKIPSGANTDSIKPVPKEYAREKLGYATDLQILVFEGGSGGSGVMPQLLRQLLQSFHIATISNDKLRLVIVGCLPNKQELELIKTLGISDLVDFVPRQPYERLTLFLGIADLLVLPLESDEIFRAGLPGRFGDYMCAGRPILAHKVGDVADIISKKNIGLTARPGDAVDFAQKINDIVSNKGLCEKFGNNARRIAEKEYSWQKMAEKLLAIYEDRIRSDYSDNGKFKWT